MKEFLFYIEGINKEVWFKEEKEDLARAGVWMDMTNEEQDACVQLECLDVRDVLEEA